MRQSNALAEKCACPPEFHEVQPRLLRDFRKKGTAMSHATASKIDSGTAAEMICVGPLEALKQKGVVVVTGADRPIAVFYHDGKVSAVDNRCPHLGFPLHRGTVKDGILTCHWHEASFDLCSGCTFDLFADDAPSFVTLVRDGIVYVAPTPRSADDRAHHQQRLEHGLRHNISLIQGKAILGLRKAGAKWPEILRVIANYGARFDDNWQQGMTIAAIVGNLLPHLSAETAYYAVLRAGRQVAIDCEDAVPHRKLEPLDTSDHQVERLTRWMRHWIRSRQRDGAERVLLTAVGRFGRSPALADLVFSAAAERVYANIGHPFDAANKAFEMLETIGWSHAEEILPLVLEQMATARGAEEDSHWHHPVEVIEPLRAVEQRLPEILAGRVDKTWNDNGSLHAALLGDDPLRMLALLENTLRDGADPVELSKRVAYAAALRLVHFGKANEVGDWFNARHTFIFANAVHQALKRNTTPGVVRALFHAAVSVYMDRFLVIPPARLPEQAALDKLPREPAALRAQLLELLDSQGALDECAQVVARYLDLGHPIDGLIDVLTLATVREDFDFHAIQVLEAGVEQYGQWQGRPEGRNIVIGVARQLAAFCPTPRAAHHLASTAMRLEHGEKMYADETD